MPFDDSLADGESDPGSREFFASVQSLEDAKDPLEVLCLNALAVVAYCEYPSPGVVRGGGDVYPRSRGTPKLDGIADEVLE